MCDILETGTAWVPYVAHSKVPEGHFEAMASAWKRFPRLTGTDPKVVLMGDSVLDNFYWLRDPCRSLRLVLEERLKQGGVQGSDTPTMCLNLAVDQMTTFDFLDRGRENRWSVYQNYRTSIHSSGDDPLDRDGYTHLKGSDGRIRSGENLECLNNVKHAFVSCGGNDVYLNADIQKTLITSLLWDKRQEVAKGMGDRMRGILKQLRETSPGVRYTLVVCYHPHHGFSISGLSGGCLGGIATTIQRSQLSWMVTPALREMLGIAREAGCDVIDLSQTFDPTDVLHYGNMDAEHSGWSGAEPSDVSQEFIATLMVDVMNARAANPDGPPHCYYGKTSGKEYLETRTVPLTKQTIATYDFQKGFKPLPKPKAASEGSCLGKKVCSKKSKKSSES
eukprot:TRINITY_DN6396_c0_g1_i2.p1 TRINITY_DN6396_c0_g1~~TRINITY_DN6396_c0_g1_i2.p1  ORF type:complete len:391 (+),score=151.03 TRINITY_DN6396_c0_g1_i2:3-1175(+)